MTNNHREITDVTSQNGLFSLHKLIYTLYKVTEQTIVNRSCFVM